MNRLKTSVLIASTRPKALVRCLTSLAAQTISADEIIVVWQGEDTPTRDAALLSARELNLTIHIIHSVETGVVPAENAALEIAIGDVLLLIDDDATAPSDWLARHLAHYRNPEVGAVGGPFTNHEPDGSSFSVRSADPVGRISWFGKAYGNMNDQPVAWRHRQPLRVHHLAGGNMSFRRAAIAQFENRLKRYWQFFEMDACLQVQAHGYSVLFDFSNVIDHYPTGTTFRAGRDGDLEVKVYNPAYNHAFVLSKHVSGWRRIAVLSYFLGVGSMGAPGLMAAVVAMWRHGRPRRELGILWRTLLARLAGWCHGRRTCDLDQPPDGFSGLVLANSNQGST